MAVWNAFSRLPIDVEPSLGDDVVKVNFTVRFEFFLDLWKGLFTHFFKQLEEEEIELLHEAVHGEGVFGIFLEKVALQLVNVVKRGNFHRVHKLVVPDFCQKYFCQVLLKLDSASDDVHKWLDSDSRSYLLCVHNILFQIDLGVQNP